MSECISHHYACDCRERVFEEVLSSLKFAEASILKLEAKTDNEKSIRAAALSRVGLALSRALKATHR